MEATDGGSLQDLQGLAEWEAAMLGQAQSATSTPFPWILRSKGLPLVLMSRQKPKETQVYPYGVVVIYNLSIWKVEAGGFPILGQPGSP